MVLHFLAAAGVLALLALAPGPDMAVVTRRFLVGAEAPPYASPWAWFAVSALGQPGGARPHRGLDGLPDGVPGPEGCRCRVPHLSRDAGSPKWRVSPPCGDGHSRTREALHHRAPNHPVERQDRGLLRSTAAHAGADRVRCLGARHARAHPCRADARLVDRIRLRTQPCGPSSSSPVSDAPSTDSPTSSCSPSRCA